MMGTVLADSQPIVRAGEDFVASMMYSLTSPSVNGHVVTIELINALVFRFDHAGLFILAR